MVVVWSLRRSSVSVLLVELVVEEDVDGVRYRAAYLAARRVEGYVVDCQAVLGCRTCQGA